VWSLVAELWWNAVGGLSRLEYGDEASHFLLPGLVAPLLFFAAERCGVARRPPSPASGSRSWHSRCWRPA